MFLSFSNQSALMLFCDRSLQVAEFLLAMFQKRQIVKHYWCLTKSVPNPQQGLLLLTAVNMFIVSYYLIVCDTFIADIQIKCYVICMLYKGAPSYEYDAKLLVASCCDLLFIVYDS